MSINSFISIFLSLMANNMTKTNHVQDFPHYYIYDTSEKENIKSYQFGQFKNGNHKILKIDETLDSTLWINKLCDRLSELPEDKKGIIIYIHGFQGDNKPFMAESGYIIQNQIFDVPQHGYGLAISLQWKTSFKYEESVLNALEKGKHFASFVNTIVQKANENHPDTKVSIICHSMGNRVFQGLYEEWLNTDPRLKLNTVFLCAADLESDVFNHHFADLSTHAGLVYIYHNLDDRTLQMANILSAHQRLGVIGPSLDSIPSNFVIRDATAIRDDETFAGRMSLHRYYYGSPTIRKEIVGILSRKD